jgi:hypothetical protein
MNSHSSLDPILNSPLKNKGFAIVDTLFTQHGWTLNKNDENIICYIKKCDETSHFDIIVLPNQIVVIAPIKNSTCLYRTTFTNYYDASEYIKSKIIDYN